MPALPAQAGRPRTGLHAPVGRAPKESVFYSDELRAQLDALPEHIRVLIGHVSVFEGTVTFTLYDEANDVDRFIGPIDLTRFADGEQLREAIEVLIGRLGRVLAADFNYGHDAVYMPNVGRAPKESVFYDEDLRAQLDALPEHIRVLIGHVSIFEGTVTFTLYDEANDVDRQIGPIDLTRLADGEQLREAIEVLIGRLGRVLAADFN